MKSSGKSESKRLLRRRRPWAAPSVTLALLVGCGAAVPGEHEDPAAGEATEEAGQTEDGLADAYDQFLQNFVNANFDSTFQIGFGFHPGMNTETVVGSFGGKLRGSAALDMNTGHVTGFLTDVPDNGNFDLWFVKNVPGTGRSAVPEAGDQFLKVGSFEGEGDFRTLDVELAFGVNFDFDLLVVTRANKTPAQSRVAVGERTVLEKRLFRFRQNKTLDPVSGALAKDIETDDPLVARGAQIFFNETFGGNGRTCGTCHRADNNLTIDPAFIAKLPQNDPLFVAENNPALADLENPALLRSRGLILENVDGFEDPKHKFVMRGVPHTLSLTLTNGMLTGFGFPPDHRLGWSGDGGPGRSTLQQFAFGAIIQHFTKNLKRRPGVDFRLPTQEELDALEAFQLFTGRQKSEDFFSRFPTDEGAAAGRELFFGVGCTSCHDDLFEFGNGGFNQNFDTGVRNLTPELVFDDGFGTPGDGTFNVPPVAEAADTAPLFHNNAAPTIEDAVAFYFSQTFRDSPSGFFIFGDLGTEEQQDIAAFLRVVNSSTNLTQVRKRLEYVRTHRSTGNTDLLKIAIADARDARVVLLDKDLNRAVRHRIKDLEQILTNARGQADDRRPQMMRRAIAVLDEAADGLFTTEPPGSGGVGGFGGVGGVGAGGFAGDTGEGGVGNEGGTFAVGGSAGGVSVGGAGGVIGGVGGSSTGGVGMGSGGSGIAGAAPGSGGTGTGGTGGAGGSSGGGKGGTSSSGGTGGSTGGTSGGGKGGSGGTSGKG